MTSIFISHSKKDAEIRSFFEGIFATTHIKAFFKEIEGFSSKEPSEEIKRNIQNSNAVFVLLGEKVQKLRHTNDWVAWESGVAKGLNKDIWVFEPSSLLGKIKVVISHVSHYVLYEPDEFYQDYIRKIINSYKEFKNIVPATLTGAAIGATGGTLTEVATTKKKKLTGLGTIIGSLIGAVGGAIIGGSSQKHPKGIKFKCPHCGITYGIHTNHPKIRCPICNEVSEVDWDSIKK
ncbi:MAG: hypothetical protein ACFFCM_18815 [Promethearchaeota archaeon]